LIVKLASVLKGWRYAIWRDEKHEQLARNRAEICSGCEHAKHGKILKLVGDDIKEIQGHYCGLCDCPLSAKLRSEDETCDDGRW